VALPEHLVSAGVAFVYMSQLRSVLFKYNYLTPKTEDKSETH
jgi:hypothetical protein